MLRWRAKDSPGLQAKFTGRVALQPGATVNARLHSKWLKKSRKVTRVDGLALPEVFTREKVNPFTRETLSTQIG